MKKRAEQGVVQTAQAGTLDELFQNGQAVADGDLVCALKGRISLVAGGDRVILDEGFMLEPVKKRLVAVGLARHALVRKGALEESELFRSVEWYAEQVQERPQTVAQELSRLKGKHKVFGRGDTGYGVPSWAIRKAIEFVGKA